jgi:hypothetical protein
MPIGQRRAPRAIGFAVLNDPSTTPRARRVIRTTVGDAEVLSPHSQPRVV